MLSVMFTENSLRQINAKQYQNCWKLLTNLIVAVLWGTKKNPGVHIQHAWGVALKLPNGYKGKNKDLLFRVLIIWQEPINYFDTCYFCLTKVLVYLKNKSSILYSNVPSAMRPILHGKDIAIPTAPACWQEISDSGRGFPNTTAVASTLRDKAYVLEEFNT